MTSTLAALSSWIVALVVVAGCGYATRRAIAGSLSYKTAPTLVPPDIWIGIAVVLIYLQGLSLLTGIDGRTVWPLAAMGVTGSLLGMPRPLPRRTRVRGRTLIVCVLVLLVSAVFANAALGAATSYDTALYHLAAIEYIREFGTVPGLGNLHDRLGSGVGHFVFAAGFDVGPWSGAGFHLPNGFLVVLLLVDVAMRGVRRHGDREPATRLFGLFLVFGVFLVAVAEPFSRISSPSLDLPVFVLSAAAAIYAAACVERGTDLASALAVAAAASAACATRPTLAPTAVLLLVCVVAMTERSLRARTAAAVALVPAAMATVWLARQTLLSGYPFFPLHFAAVDVEWRMPSAAVDHYSRAVRAWAREPGAAPVDVLEGWGWIPGWAARVATDGDLIPGFALLSVAVLAALLLRRPADLLRRGARTRFLVWALAAQASSVVLLLVVAPDARFMWAPFWISVAAVATWALASSSADADPALQRHVLNTALVVALFIGGFLVVAGPPLVSPDGSGPFGTPAVHVPQVIPVETKSGLVIFRPSSGDQCFRVRLCTPQPKRALGLRGETLAAGLTVRHPRTPDTP